MCSRSFNIHQGVKQGGVLSPLLYSIYLNDLLIELQQSKLGVRYRLNPSKSKIMIFGAAKPKSLGVNVTLNGQPLEIVDYPCQSRNVPT